MQFVTQVFGRNISPEFVNGQNRRNYFRMAAVKSFQMTRTETSTKNC